MAELPSTTAALLPTLRTKLSQLPAKVEAAGAKEKDEMMGKLKGIGDSVLGESREGVLRSDSELTPSVFFNRMVRPVDGQLPDDGAARRWSQSQLCVCAQEEVDVRPSLRTHVCNAQFAIRHHSNSYFA